MIDPRLKEAGEALLQIAQSGDENAWAEVTRRYMQGDLNNVKAEAAQAAELAYKNARAVDRFNTEYSDIVEDPALYAYAQKLEFEERQKNPKDFDFWARFQRVGDRVRKMRDGDEQESTKEAWEQVTKGRRISSLTATEEPIEPGEEEKKEKGDSSIIADMAEERRRLQAGIAANGGRKTKSEDDE